MNPPTHFLFPFFFGLVLTTFAVISWKLALLTGIVGILIDVDHYIEHILHAKTDKFSLRDTWNNSIRLHRFNQRSFIHEGIGILLVTVILGIVAAISWPLALALALGYYSHILLDDIHTNAHRYLRGKILNLWVEEPYAELILDMLLIVGIFVLLIV